MTTHALELGLLIALVFCMAFFSSAETSMMSINRYRLKHLSKSSKRAKRVEKLLERPDRLLGIILLGSTFITISLSSIGTVLAVDLLGERWGIIAADVILTLILLIFGEVMPKTLAALYPEKVALPFGYFLKLLLKLLYPLVWVVNGISNKLLNMAGASLTEAKKNLGITHEELRTIVHETTGRIPSKHRKMLLNILDLQNIFVDDIMIPRGDVVGLDLDNPWEAIVGQLANTQHTFLPVYQQDLNNLIGVLHAKKALHLILEKAFDEQKLRDALDEPFYVPQGTSLTQQLIALQKHKQRFSLVVDEYGEIQGAITLEDILEEIVGEFTTDMAEIYTSIVQQADGSLLVDGTTSVREFNRQSPWKLPTDGPKTLNGLVIQQLQMIPEIGTCCLLDDRVPVEVLKVQDNCVKTLKIFPPLKKEKAQE